MVKQGFETQEKSKAALQATLKRVGDIEDLGNNMMSELDKQEA